MTSSITPPRRIQSLDVFRAITMFFMLFVNEMAGVKGLPHILYNAGMNEDMLGFMACYRKSMMYLNSFYYAMKLFSRYLEEKEETFPSQ